MFLKLWAAFLFLQVFRSPKLFIKLELYKIALSFVFMRLFLFLGSLICLNTRFLFSNISLCFVFMRFSNNQKVVLLVFACFWLFFACSMLCLYAFFWYITLIFLLYCVCSIFSKLFNCLLSPYLSMFYWHFIFYILLRKT